MEITWTTLFLFAGTSGLLSALVSHAFSRWNEWRSRHDNAAYLAIRIATALETFADDCMSVIGNFDTYRQSKGSAGKPTTKLPAIPNYPEDADGWRSLPTFLTAKILAFPNHVRAGQESISFTWSVADDEAAWNDCEQESAKLGLAAWELANELRLKFSFPPFEPRYDIAGALRREVARWKVRSNAVSDLLT